MADDLRDVLAKIAADISSATGHNQLRDLDELYELLARIVTAVAALRRPSPNLEPDCDYGAVGAGRYRDLNERRRGQMAPVTPVGSWVLIALTGAEVLLTDAVVADVRTGEILAVGPDVRPHRSEVGTHLAAEASKIIATLSPREEAILDRRFGIGPMEPALKIGETVLFLNMSTIILGGTPPLAMIHVDHIMARCKPAEAPPLPPVPSEP
jgi:hypothetical protein